MSLTPEEEEEWKVIKEVLRRMKGDELAERWDEFRKNFYPNKSVQQVTATRGSGITGTDFIKDFLLKAYKHEVKAYKKTDKLMNLGTEISEGDDIYIDCRPTNVYGEEVNPAENIIDNNATNAVFDELSNKINGQGMLGKTIFDNIGFQILVGIILLAIIYFTGKYIFISFPSKFVND